MDIIDITEVINYYKEKIKVILIIMIIVVFMGCIYGIFIQTPKYSSSTTILLVGSTSNDSALTYNDLSLNKNLVSTYSEIVRSKRILNQVIDNLNLDYSYEELSNMIRITAVADTELIRITVTGIDKELVKDITNETANVFSKEILDLYNISNVNVLDKAELAKKPSNMSAKNQFVLFIIIGLVLGSGVVFLMYYFDRTVKTKEQIEQKLQVPVIGTVQEYKGK